MKLTAIHGKILELTKHVHLQPPAGIQSYREQFLGNGIIVTWWTTDQSRRALKLLAATAMRSRPQLAAGDVTTFSEAIAGSIKDRLFQPNYFDIGLPPQPTLFSTIAPSDKGAFAAKLWQEMLAACEATTGSWLTIYPLRKVTLTHSQQFGNVHLLNAQDAPVWSALHGLFPLAAKFDPVLAQFAHDGKGYGFPLGASVYLAGTHSGTAKGARYQAARDFNQLIAIAFALRHEDHSYQLARSGADAESHAIQLAGGRKGNVTFGSIGPLFPPLLHTFDFDAPLLAAMAAWFGKSSAASTGQLQRAVTAAAFLHRAIVDDGVDRFLHAFIVLDALFGERHKVEAKITEGVGKVFSNEVAWVQRVGLLFDLRSELVHGAISDLVNWPEEDSYEARFRAEPSADAMTMATTALGRYFDLG